MNELKACIEEAMGKIVVECDALPMKDPLLVLNRIRTIASHCLAWNQRQPDLEAENKELREALEYVDDVLHKHPEHHQAMIETEDIIKQALDKEANDV